MVDGLSIEAKQFMKLPQEQRWAVMFDNIQRIEVKVDKIPKVKGFKADRIILYGSQAALWAVMIKVLIG